ncbi:MAG: hypothetical protein U9N14_02045 [Pseudomonadota bacterium]|nr:hypothetical protein [Pseudomonadota bacterium]
MRQLLRFLFKGGRCKPSIEVGAVFRRTYNNVTEIACVRSVAPDSLGIMHVRFEVDIERGRVVTTCLRTLSLSSFADLYRERID